MEKKNLESLAANEFAALEMTEIRGGRETNPEDVFDTNPGCTQTNCPSGCTQTYCPCSEELN